MVETKSLFVKEVRKTELVAYFIDYLKEHVYIKGKHIATDYLKAYGSYNRNNNEIRLLRLNFSKLIIVAYNLGFLTKFNGSTYRVVKPINYKKLQFKLIRTTKMKGFTIGALSDVRSFT